MTGRILSLAVLIAFCIVAASHGADAYYTVPLNRLTIVDRIEPPGDQGAGVPWRLEQAMQPYCVLDGPGDAFVTGDAPRQRWEPRAGFNESHLLVRTPAADKIAGTLVIRSENRPGMTRIRFTAATTGFESDRVKYLQARRAHYQELFDRQLPGAAWFRHQVREIDRQLGAPVESDSRWQDFRRPNDELTDTFALLGGGRAVSENLQLNRALAPATQSGAATVETSTIPGITVQEMDFKPLLADTKPELDPLADLVPADQHAVFFPSFAALTDVIDRAQHDASLLATMADDTATGDARTQQRYERQLCLSITALGRALGPAVVKSVAITGSDPYLLTGSDLAVIFEARNAQVLSQLLSVQAQVAAQEPAVRSVAGDVDGVAYSGVVTADRSVCSYRAIIGDAVVVTNSLTQLRQIVTTHSGKLAALSSLPEYHYFRQQYQRGSDDESALLILSDATIRRWCGPRWRIADSRRTRAAAAMSEVQAANAQVIVNGSGTAAATRPASDVPGLDEVRIGSNGAVSDTYGTLNFMTPIVELDMNRVTEAESRAYANWRNGYQRNWRWAFDPIACRIGVKQNQLSCDLMVIPLIAASDYRPFIAITSGAALTPGAADPHQTIAHLAIAVNPDSDTLRSWGRMLQNLSGNLRIEPLAWLGSCVALYADPDPFWDELRAAPDTNKFMDDNYQRLPVALYAESRDPLRLAAFLTAVRAFVEQSAPGIATWETLEYNGRPYVKVSANQGDNNGFLRAVYYAATPKAWIVSLNEQTIQRALDRQPTTQPSSQPATQPAYEWLGKNLSLHLGREMSQVFEQASRSEMATAAQIQAWRQLPILNEWKQIFPDKDPAAVQEQLFGVRVTDPAGEAYRWNDQWKTMESPVYGHPGEPKAGPAGTQALGRYAGDMGITFEHGGLRARAVIQQTADDRR